MPPTNIADFEPKAALSALQSLDPKNAAVSTIDRFAEAEPYVKSSDGRQEWAESYLCWYCHNNLVTRI